MVASSRIGRADLRVLERENSLESDCLVCHRPGRSKALLNSRSNAFETKLRGEERRALREARRETRGSQGKSGMIIRRSPSSNHFLDSVSHSAENGNTMVHFYE